MQNELDTWGQRINEIDEHNAIAIRQVNRIDNSLVDFKTLFQQVVRDT